MTRKPFSTDGFDKAMKAVHSSHKEIPLRPRDRFCWRESQGLLVLLLSSNPKSFNGDKILREIRFGPEELRQLTTRNRVMRFCEEAIESLGFSVEYEECRDIEKTGDFRFVIV